jgi:DNA-binding NarL/FixJ family response regulator
LFLSRELLKERKHMAGLNKKYAGIQLQLKDANQKLKDGKKSFHQVIQWQFTEWKLSPSEQDVALLVLKGLSFKEIAALRETKEKTVRQQATSIYSKTGLNGRHEFAAWFFEDML